MDTGFLGKRFVSFPTSARVCAVTVITALALLTSGCNPKAEVEKKPEAVTLPQPKTCIYSSKERASALLTKLFPNSELLTFEPLQLDDSKTLCLLEVEMLADKGDPHTKGFVYVFPDGERFLNGPLMDKRSKVEVQTTEDINALISKEKDKQRRILEEAGVQEPDQVAPLKTMADQAMTPAAESTPPQASPVTPPLVQTPDQVKALQVKFLADLTTLPSITIGSGARDVYVMFEPTCQYCRRLFDEQDSISKQYGVKFHWVPMFTNDKSWAMTAFLLKTYKTAPEKGPELFKKMMNMTWDPQIDAAGINAMKDDDYAVPRQASLVFADAARTNRALGTPLVVFKRPDDTIDVISGIPRTEDWKVFDQAEQVKPAKASRAG